MLEQLKQEVCAANLKLVEYGLVVLTWGNVSAITEDRRYVVIKPSGVDYAAMTPEQMVVVDLEGTVAEAFPLPSSVSTSPYSSLESETFRPEAGVPSKKCALT